MGGRKTTELRRIVGTSSNYEYNIKKLKKSIQDQKPRGIVTDTVEIVKNSKMIIDNLSYTLYFSDIITKLISDEIKGYDEIKKLVTDYWLKIKEEKQIDTSIEIDKILIETAVNTIKKEGSNG